MITRKTLTEDMLCVARGQNMQLTRAQAAWLAVDYGKDITAHHLTRAYWKQLTRIVNAYLRQQCAKDRAVGCYTSPKAPKGLAIAV